MTSICIIHIIEWIYWLLNEHKDMVLRTVFSIILSLWLHTARLGSAYLENVLGGSALQVKAGTLQSTLRWGGSNLSSNFQLKPPNLRIVTAKYTIISHFFLHPLSSHLSRVAKTQLLEKVSPPDNHLTLLTDHFLILIRMVN